MAEQQFDWGKFDKQVDLKELQEDAKEVEENGGGDFAEVPEGEYEVAIEKMEFKESRKGDPMLTIWFEIVEGEYESQKIFYNGVMQPQNDKAWGFQVHRNNEMLRALWDCDYDDVEFKSFSEYAKLIDDVFDDVDGQFEYLLSKTTNKQGYDQYDIKEVFELD